VCKQLFIIEVVSEDDDTKQLEDAADPTISIHAMTRIQPYSARTMKLIVDVHGVQLTALLDSGSTHNFIDTETAAQASISLSEHSRLHFAVANRDHLQSSGCCRALKISVRDKQFTIDYYGLALGSYNMALGVQWLESLWTDLVGFPQPLHLIRL
jgi:hypothetical protein